MCSRIANPPSRSETRERPAPLGTADMSKPRVTYEPLEDPETLAWWSLTPGQRFLESQRLWATFLTLGGSLDPEPDWQSPFYFSKTSSPRAAHGGPGLYSIRRRRVQPRHRHRNPGKR